MNNSNIRKPVTADIEVILALWCEQFSFHHRIDNLYYVKETESRVEQYRRYLMEAIIHGDPEAFVGERNGKIAGFITFKEARNDYLDTNLSCYGQILELFVHPDARHSGLGRLLIAAAEKVFKEKGLSYISLCCSSYNTNALAFYSTQGFVNRQSQLFKAIE